MIKISDLIQQKFSEIQSRIPIKLKGPDNLFEPYLDDATKTLVEPTKNSFDSLNFNTVLKSSQLGSYEADYPLLSFDEISELMPKINSAIDEASKKYGIDKNLIRAVIKQESDFQPYALSTSGAEGLMQLMPNTATWVGVDDSYDIYQNILGGTRYLKDQLVTFNGDISLALAAYNAGPSKVKEANGIPNIQQTQSYVKKILEYYNLYSSSQNNLSTK